MFCAFFSLLMICGGLGVLVWFGWQRLAAHLRDNPAAAKLLAEHVVVPILTGHKEPKEDSKPEAPDAKGTPGQEGGDAQ